MNNTIGYGGIIVTALAVAMAVGGTLLALNYRGIANVKVSPRGLPGSPAWGRRLAGVIFAIGGWVILVAILRSAI